MKLIRSLQIAAISISLLVTAACQTVQNPATGESQFTTISPAQERAIGRENHPKILAQFGGEVRNPELRAYVDRVGRGLAQHAELPADQFTFTVLDTPVVNAFALPGGFVYVTRGMLAVLNSEAELAGVLGHEIGHVTARHGATPQDRGTVAGLIVLGAALLTDSREVAQLGQVAAAGYLAGYSRDQERQSDSLGIRYISRAGYDPNGMSEGLKALGRHGSLLARTSGRQAQQLSFLSTHPQTPERVAATSREARGVKVAPNPRVGRDAYLDAIDGMVFGHSEQQGFARGDRFSHPTLRFTFAVPEAFRLDNLPQAVIATERRGRAQIIFDQERNVRLARTGVRMDTYIARQWAANARLSGLERLNINGLNAATAVTRINANGSQQTARLVAIRFDRDTIYRFVFVTSPNDSRAFDRQFRRTIFSFRRISDREARRLEPQRIELVRVRRGDSISRLTRFDAQDGFEDDRFRTINGMDRGDVLRAGDTVKVIR